MEPVIRVEDLRVAYREHGSWLRVLHGVDFSIRRGEVFGLVGESGCGKSTVGLQLMGYRHPNMRVETGEVLFRGENLLAQERSKLDRLRGDRIGFVPQNPTTALNPAIRVGAQVAETLFLHKRVANGEQAAARTDALLELVGLPDPQRLRRRYPHELSGGQQQRVCIAMAVACDPDLIVLDEPTTGLDVTTQEQIVSLLVDLRSRLGTSMLYVTHDLGLLAQIADRIGVMYAGYLVETGTARSLFDEPRHPYTVGLIASVPRIEDPLHGSRVLALKGALRRRELPRGCPFAPRCSFAEPSCFDNPQRLEEIDPGHDVACQRWKAVERTLRQVELAPDPAGAAAGPAGKPLLSLKNVTLAYGASGGFLSKLGGARPFVAVEALDFAIERGETLALVGESGSGKSTVARAISGLLPPLAGAIHLDGIALAPSYRARDPDQRRNIQYIFQNPDASLNPRRPVGRILARPLELFHDVPRSEIAGRIEAALADVQLESSYASRYPDQLSGGERQRVAIARALIAGPELLLCDEILSALDVSVQANIIELLRMLRRERDVSMLFISHDLAVVRSIADRVGVLFRGQLMEIGATAGLFEPPCHPYTHTLLRAVPSVATVKPRSPRTAAASEAIAGAACAFAGRCPWQVGAICVEEAPPWRTTRAGIAIRCHIPLDELAGRTGPADAPVAVPPSARKAFS